MPSPVRHVGLNAHLLSGRSTYRSAGIHHYIHNLLAHLPTADPELQLTFFLGEGDAPAAPNVTLRRSRWPTGRPALRIAWEQLALPWIAAAARLDLLHSLAFVSPLISAAPSVVTVYDLAFLKTPQNFRAMNRLYLRALTGPSCRRARAVFAISESTRRDAAAAFGLPLDRIVVVYPGCDPEFRPLPRETVEAFRAARGLPDHFVLYLGTLEPRKQVDTLVRAFARIRGGGWKLVLAGAPGWGGDAIYRAIEAAGLSGEVILPGYVPADEKPLWYNAARVFAYPSAYEGFGLPVLEALACGVPVITTNVASLPEVAGDAARLVPPGDVAALADALAALTGRQAEREALMRRGPQQAAKFSWAASAQRTAQVYRQVIAAPRRAASHPLARLS